MEEVILTLTIMKLTIQSTTMTTHLLRQESNMRISSLGAVLMKGMGSKNLKFKQVENIAVIEEQLHNWTAIAESNPLLGSENNELRRGIMIEADVHHPFNSHENQTASSMLLPRDGIVQGC